MSTLIRIGVFYGAPIAAVVVAVTYFFVLARRVRLGIIARPRAALRYALTLLLPVVVLIAIWATAELSSYFASAGSLEWDRDASIGVLIGLLPIAGYVALPIIALNIAFWAIARSRKA